MAQKTWIDWPNQCPVCGGDVKVLTASIEPRAYDGDHWRCEDGHEGGVVVDDDGVWLMEPA